jgi:acyl-[acyl-carrier-protein]-phospholipid O-acyltransferase/long-chain-fatty-acid--[acyl-carrier-protein] ligase
VLIVGVVGMMFAAVGWLAARRIPPALPGGDELPRPRLLHDSLAVLQYSTRRPALWLPILAISWFWLFGATVVSGLPLLVKNVLFANEQVVTLTLALFAIGVGVGSVVAERLLHGDVSARHVPIAAVGMGVFAIDIHSAASAARRAPTSPDHTVSRHVRELARAVRPHRSGDRRRSVLRAAVCAAAARERAAYRARVIAANNIINALAMAAGASRRRCCWRAV